MTGLPPHFDFGQGLFNQNQNGNGTLHLTAYAQTLNGVTTYEPVIFQAMASDPDGGPITYSISGGSGLTINSTTGVFEWQPTSTTGVSFTVVATDNDPLTAELPVVIDVDNSNVPSFYLKADSGGGGPAVTAWVCDPASGFDFEKTDPAEVVPGSATCKVDIVDGGAGYEYSVVDDDGGDPDIVAGDTTDHAFQVRVTAGDVGFHRARLQARDPISGRTSTISVYFNVLAGDTTTEPPIVWLRAYSMDNEIVLPTNDGENYVEEPASLVDWSIPSSGVPLNSPADSILLSKVQVEITAQPKHGTAEVVDVDGEKYQQILYVPDEGFVGVDSVDYHIVPIEDGVHPGLHIANGNTATIQIVVGNGIGISDAEELDDDAGHGNNDDDPDPRTGDPNGTGSGSGGGGGGGGPGGGLGPGGNGGGGGGGDGDDCTCEDLSVCYDPATDPLMAVTVSAGQSFSSMGFTANLLVNNQVISSAGFSTGLLNAKDSGKIYLPIHAPNLPTGQYDYKIQLVDGSNNLITEFSSKSPLKIDHHDQTGVGDDWHLMGINRLMFESDGSGGLSPNVTKIDWQTSLQHEFSFNVADIPAGTSTAAGAMSEDDPNGAQLRFGSGTEAGVTPFLTLQDKKGNRSLFDSDGREVRRIDANGNVTSYSYTDANGDGKAWEIASITYPTGKQVTFSYSGNKLHQKIEFDERSSGASKRITTYSYNTDNLLASISEAQEGTGTPTLVTSYEYDEQHRLNKVTKPDGTVTRYDRDYFGNGVIVTHEGDTNYTSTLLRTYVPPSLVYSQMSLGGQVMVVSSDNKGIHRTDVPYQHPTREGLFVDGSGHAHTIIDDGDGNITGGTTDDVADVSRTYNSARQETSVTTPDPDGEGPLTAATTYKHYNENHSLYEVVYPDDSSEHWYYTNTSFPGIATKYVDRLGHVTIYTLNSHGNVSSERHVVNGTDTTVGSDDVITNYTYTTSSDGIAGLLKTVEDPLQHTTHHVTTYEYWNDVDHPEKFGQVKQITYPDNSTVQYDYDQWGNLSQEIDQLGRYTQYEYDTLGRLIKTTSPDPDTGAITTNSPTTKTHYNSLGQVDTTTDANGAVTTYEYDSHGRVQYVMQPNPTTGLGGDHTSSNPKTETHYDANGNVDYTLDPLERRTDYQYDAWNRLTVTKLPAPDPTQPTVRPTITRTYDAAGNLKTEKDARNAITTYYYDEMNRVVKIVAPKALDGAADDPTSLTTTYTYDAAGDQATVTVAGATTTYQYDELGRLARQIMPKPSDGSGFTGSLTATIPSDRPYIKYTYDKNGNVLTTTDGRNKVTTNEYDELGRLIHVIQPDPTSGAGGDSSSGQPMSSYTYDTAGQLLTTTDPVGRVTTYQYDALGRLVRQIMPHPDDGAGFTGDLDDPVDTGASFVIYSYDAVGNKLTETDANLQTTTYAYDHLNRLTSVTQPNPGDGAPVTSYTYDAAGELLTTTDPLSHVTTNQYDDLGRLVRQIMPNPTTNTAFSGDLDDAVPTGVPYTVYTYDLNGNLKSQTDALGHTTSYDYDFLNRLVCQVDPNGNASGATPSQHTTHYTYDGRGNRASLTDPVGNVTEWTYDYDNRLLTEKVLLTAAVGSTPAVYGTRSYSYDAGGNLTQLVDRDGRKTTYDYDVMNRPTAEKWYATESSTSPDYQISNSYYDDGSLEDASAGPAGSSNYDASYHYDYYGDGRLSQTVATHLAGLASQVTVAQQYDLVGNLATLKGTVIGGNFDFFNTYHYDPLNRLDQATQFGLNGASFLGFGSNTVADKSFTIAYNALGQFTSINRYASLDDSSLVAQGTYAYDHANRLTGLTYKDASNTTLEHYAWQYDAASRITHFTNSLHSTETLTYSYDANGQLTNYSAGSYGETYNYDHNGNRTDTSTAVLGVGVANFDYETGLNNQLNSDGLYQYTYDNEGNLIQKTVLDGNGNGDPTGATTIYTWDQRNRLTSVTQYDTAAHASSHTAPTWVVTYKYDMFNNMVERQESDGSSSTSEHFIYDQGQVVLKLADNGSVMDRYLWAPAIDMLLAQEDENNDVLWALDDNLNSIRDWVDSSGDVVAHHAFDAYGNELLGLSSGSANTDFAWTGRFHDPLTGLQYNTNRWYDAATGRWISRDPIGFDGDPSNTYRYVNNGPTSGFDPTGELERVLLGRPEIGKRIVGYHVTWTRFKLDDTDNCELVLIQHITVTGGGSDQNPYSPSASYFEVLGVVEPGGRELNVDDQWWSRGRPRTPDNRTLQWETIVQSGEVVAYEYTDALRKEIERWNSHGEFRFGGTTITSGGFKASDTFDAKGARVIDAEAEPATATAAWGNVRGKGRLNRLTVIANGDRLFDGYSNGDAAR